MKPQTRAAIFKRFKNNNPKPATELIYHSPFELLIEVIVIACSCPFFPSIFNCRINFN